MGAQAKQRYERLFTGEVMGKRYFALYKELLGEPGVSQDGARHQQAAHRG